MTFSNVKLIFAREVRDQLRDRRTLFMIAVLPLVLYPLLGVSLLQVTQFMQEKTTRVLVVGACDLHDAPALFDGERFADVSGGAKLLELKFATKADSPNVKDEARAAVQRGDYEAALYFPSDFSARLDAFRENIRHRGELAAARIGDPAKEHGDSSQGVGHSDRSEKSLVESRHNGILRCAQNDVASGKQLRKQAASSKPLAVPSPEIIHNTTSEKSMITFARLSEALGRWMDRIGADNLHVSGVSAVAMHPFLVETADVSDARHREGAAWSKLLPVLLLIWALTGAFYPAIDLCAGEKERGTIETLLCSPAERSEIVLGKLLTIMLFSVATAVLNLGSMGLTGSLMMTRLPGFGFPPVAAVVALGVALLPVAALFSALCLALAAFARSTKEGQYYLMPLLLITMPLVVLPMSPGVELSLGTSLIPITGIVLVLRNVLEGDYAQALLYSPVVAAVTAAACAMAIRWAIEQFNSESVLFRECERLDLGLWVRRLLRERRPTPTVAAAVCCAVLILLVQFFLSISSSMPDDFAGFVRSIMTSQFAVILAPALLMTLFFTSSLRQTLLLKRPHWLAVPAAVALAIVLHPTATVLQSAVRQLYPVSENVRPALEKMSALLTTADFWPLLLVIAVLPAVCEELAFRGFILSGFRGLGNRWRAIVCTSLLFGLTHGVLQQSLLASLLGAILAYLAIQSGSILPGMAFHMCHNGLAVANCRITPDIIPPNWPLLRAVVAPASDGGCAFTTPAVVAGAMAAFLILAWFSRFPGWQTAKATDHGATKSLPGLEIDAQPNSQIATSAIA